MTDREINKIVKDNNIKYCYIKKGAYYRPRSSGYTDYITKAGVFTKDEARIHATDCREIIIIPIDIKEHNSIIFEEIKELVDRIIKTEE